MIAFLVGFLVFLAAAAALAWAAVRRRSREHACGACPGRDAPACDPHGRASTAGLPR